MKNIILFFRSNSKRNMTALMLAVAFSILVCAVFYNFWNSFTGHESKPISVGIIDQDQSSISKDFKRYLTEELNIQVLEENDYDKFSNQLLEKDISAIIEIPNEYEKNGIQKGTLSNVITTTLDDYENAAFLKSYIELYFSSVNLMIASANGSEDRFAEIFSEYPNHGKVIEQSAALTRDTQKEAASLGLGQAAGFFTMMMMGLSLCTAFVVLEDRQSGIFGRIQISPVKASQYIIGTSLFSIFTCLLVVATFCSYLWINQYPIGVPIPYLAAVMSLFAVFMIGLGLVVSLFCHTKNAVMSFIVIFGSTGPILGGAYFPVDMSPELLQRLSKITPHYWMMQGIKDLMENPGADVQINLVILTLFVVLSFLVTAVKFVQKQENRA